MQPAPCCFLVPGFHGSGKTRAVCPAGPFGAARSSSHNSFGGNIEFRPASILPPAPRVAGTPGFKSKLQPCSAFFRGVCTTHEVVFTFVFVVPSLSCTACFIYQTRSKHGPRHAVLAPAPGNRRKNKPWKETPWSGECGRRQAKSASKVSPCRPRPLTEGSHHFCRHGGSRGLDRRRRLPP